MTVLVVDASVVIKWFAPEVHADAASRLLDGQTVLYAPDLIGPELGNILWKKVRRDEIRAAKAFEILGIFQTLGVEIYSSAVLLPSALDLSVRLDRTVYDCLYLALAIAQNCPLVTADRKFHSAVAASAHVTHIRWVEDEL